MKDAIISVKLDILRYNLRDLRGQGHCMCRNYIFTRNNFLSRLCFYFEVLKPMAVLGLANVKGQSASNCTLGIYSQLLWFPVHHNLGYRCSRLG